MFGFWHTFCKCFRLLPFDAQFFPADAEILDLSLLEMYACGLFLRDSVYTKLGTLKISVFLWCQADFRTDLGCCIACALTFAFEFAASAWFQKRANRTSNKHTPISWCETGAADKNYFWPKTILRRRLAYVAHMSDNQVIRTEFILYSTGLQQLATRIPPTRWTRSCSFRPLA